MTTLIKNGLVYDGSGNEPVKQDIFIRGDRIVRLGNFLKRRAEKLIDAMGAIVVPGFIDINSALDFNLSIFEKGWEENYVREGVTTVIGGNCGVSLAPVLGDSLIALRQGTAVSKINVDWHTVGEFLNTLKKRKLGINFGTLVGHGTIRRGFIGEAIRDLTERELLTFKKILAQALKEGAFGFSVSLEFAHTKLTPRYEIEELVRVVAQEKRIYAVHLRSYEKGLDEALEETIDIAKKTGVSVEINHLMPIKKFGAAYSRAKERLEKESALLGVNFDCYPASYIASPMYQFLPDWLKTENLEKMLVHLNSEHLKKKLLEHFRGLTTDNIYLHNLPPPLAFLNSRSLKEYALNNGLKPQEALLKLMKVSGLRGVLFKESVDEKQLEDFIFSPSSFIASSEAMTDESRLFTKFIKLADENKRISLEKAIAKLTSQPAEKYKIKKRGEIREDNFADIVVLKDLNPAWVIVNGKVVLEEGNFKGGVGAGQVLKYGG